MTIQSLNQHEKSPWKTTIKSPPPTTIIIIFASPPWRGFLQGAHLETSPLPRSAPPQRADPVQQQRRLRIRRVRRGARVGLCEGHVATLQTHLPGLGGALGNGAHGKNGDFFWWGQGKKKCVFTVIVLQNKDDFTGILTGKWWNMDDIHSESSRKHSDCWWDFIIKQMLISWDETAWKGMTSTSL